MRRPSYREIDKKLREAKKASEEQKIHFIRPDVVLADLLDIDLIVDDLISMLPQIIQETKPEHYQGKHPPEKSYEGEIRGVELFAFKLVSSVLGTKVYRENTTLGIIKGTIRIFMYEGG